MKMKRIIEVGDGRVFECRLTPDVPGDTRHTMTFCLIAGEPLTEEEAARVMKEAVASLVADGVDVIAWGCE